MTASWRMPLLGFVSGAAMIYALGALVVRSAAYADNARLLAIAVAVDATVVVAALYVLLVVRRGGAPWISTVPVFLLSLPLAARIVPPAEHLYVDRVALLALPLEIVAIGYVAVKVRALRRRFVEENAGPDSIGEAIERALEDILGRSVGTSIAASEIAMLHYAAWGWRARPPRARPGEAVFSYHRVGAWPAILAALQIVIVAETVAVHMLVRQWSPAVAWGITGLSVYGALWLLGDYQAMRLRPIVLDGDRLALRLGLRWSVDVPLRAIEAIESAARPETTGDGRLNILVLGDPSVVLRLREPVLAKGFFGLRKRASRVAIAVEDPEAFVAELRRRLIESTAADSI